MTNHEHLNVWHGLELVANIWRNAAGIMGFRYTEDWMATGFPISQQLPLTTQEYLPGTGKAHQFFANLLPEAGARDHIVRDLKISNSDFELLRAIGGECAGALSILPTEREPTDTFSYKRLDQTDLITLLKRKGQPFYLTSRDDRPRLSLAGAQDKCPILFDGTDSFLPLDSAPSSHILKFEIAGYRNIPAYEYFLIKLAQSIGLPVVDIHLKKQDRHYYLLIKRYDRIPDPKGGLIRLHQEDFCQALGMSYDKKYQQEGGSSFQACYQLTREVSADPITDLEHLLRWQIFNVLAGNSDGHAKNISLLYGKGDQPRLAPFYDLVCTRAIERLDVNLAFSVGGIYNPNNIMLTHWQQFAADCGIRFPYLIGLIREMILGLETNLVKIQSVFEATHGPYPALSRINQVITKQCKRVGRQLEL